MTFNCEVRIYQVFAVLLTILKLLSSIMQPIYFKKRQSAPLVMYDPLRSYAYIGPWLETMSFLQEEK